MNSLQIIPSRRGAVFSLRTERNYLSWLDQGIDVIKRSVLPRGRHLREAKTEVVTVSSPLRKWHDPIRCLSPVLQLTGSAVSVSYCLWKDPCGEMRSLIWVSVQHSSC